jgi:hypothetical protein
MTQTRNVVPFPLTAEQEKLQEKMEALFLANVLTAYTDEHHNEDWKKLPPDMQLQTFMQGTLAGLASCLFLACGSQQRQLVIDNITKSIPYAIDLAEYELAQHDQTGAPTQ